jgi:hypothetical protein
MRSPAHDIALHIAGAGLGTFGGASGWAISVGTEPASPETTITVYDTGGEGPDTDQLDIERQTIQVRVRSAKESGAYQAAYDKQRAIRAVLINLSGVVMDGSRYLGIVMTSEILTIGRDDNDRFLMTANYRVIRQT